MPSMSERLFEHVEGLRHTSSAPALRRGGIPATEQYAYPYLAAFWTSQPYLRVPVLRFAALAADNPRLGDEPGLRLGHLLAGVVAEGDSESGVGRRISLVQQGDVERLHRLCVGLVKRADESRSGLDWPSVARMYLSWDLPEPERRHAVRRRLAEDFYQRLDRESHPDHSTSTTDKEI